jgi:GAF domain-containing protein
VDTLVDWVGAFGGGRLQRLISPPGHRRVREDMNADEGRDVGESAGKSSVESAAPRSPAQRIAEEDDLREGLAGLSQLTSRLGLEDLLTRVAHYAVRAIPGADGAGLTLLEEDRSNTVVSTAPYVREIDDLQYGIGQGPCITAARESQTVMSGSLGSDPRWRKFGGTVARLGVHSVLSLPLITPDGVVGAMNVYAHDRNVFDERAAELGEIFAVPAAVAVQNAHVLAQTQRLAARLQSALETRGIVDRAVGIVMSRSGGTADEALARLRALSQNEHSKLVVVAGQIVEDAVRRARARGHSS